MESDPHRRGWGFILRAAEKFGVDVHDCTSWDDIIRRVASNLECVCCQKPSRTVGVFDPTLPQSWGAPNGLDRGFVYGLCSIENHSADEVEARIKASL